MTQLKQEYDKAADYMQDYRMGLLGMLIERKLGLKKRCTKADSLINGYIFDISKDINKGEIKSRSEERKSHYDSV